MQIYRVKAFFLRIDGLPPNVVQDFATSPLSKISGNQYDYQHCWLFRKRIGQRVLAAGDKGTETLVTGFLIPRNA